MFQENLDRICPGNIKPDLFFLYRDPLPLRNVDFTRPWRSVHSLVETGAHMRERLASVGYDVALTGYLVEAFRCDTTSPVHHWSAASDSLWPHR